MTFAEYPGSPPSYIFPLAPGAYTALANGVQFSQLMWNPLYWFGKDGKPILNESLSLAYPPAFSDNNTIIKVLLKHWEWSNGTPVTARDVVFWMNLLAAVTDPNAPAVGSSSAPGPGWGSAVPGGFPENVVSYSQTGTYSLQFKLNASYNPTWFLYNELSQVHPIPQAAWDELSGTGPVGSADASAESRTALPNTSPTQYVPADPGTAASGALGVAQFLNSQSQDLGTYDTNPLWQVVDGSFKLSQFNSSGFVKMVPNSAYSGSPKPTISALEQLPFASDAAEYNAVLAGQVTIGYIPGQDLKQRAYLKSKGYDYASWYDWVGTWLDYNYTNPTTGPILKQLYFRQALQSLINQPQMIADFQYGLGAVNNGPVPNTPVTNEESPLEKSTKPYYPFSPAKAVSLLKTNGWTVVPGGESYCSKPGTRSGECGAGVAKNQKANFRLTYLSGFTPIDNMFSSLQVTMQAKAGIHFTLVAQPLSVLFGAIGGCSPSSPCSTWSIAFYDGWTYTPDAYPTGEIVFGCGAVDNIGDYCNSTNDANILATQTAPNQGSELKALYKYEDYSAKQLPAGWLPNTPGQYTVYKKGLTGFLPQGIFFELYPQDYHYSG